jgi:hypothetical protein
MLSFMETGALPTVRCTNFGDESVHLKADVWNEGKL